MDCPDCGCITRVIEINSYSDRVLRRRECRGCGARFTTEEGQATGPTTFEEERQSLYEAAEALGRQRRRWKRRSRRSATCRSRA